MSRMRRFSSVDREQVRACLYCVEILHSMFLIHWILDIDCMVDKSSKLDSSSVVVAIVIMCIPSFYEF